MSSMELAKPEHMAQFEKLNKEQLLELLREEVKRKQGLINDIRNLESNIEFYQGDRSAKVSLDAADIEKKRKELEESIGIIKYLCTCLDFDERRFLTEEEIGDEKKVF